MTWEEFKDYVEINGVKDNMLIEWIDVCYPILAGDAKPVVSVDEFFGRFTVG